MTTARRYAHDPHFRAYNLDHELIDYDEAARLLYDVEARRVGLDVVYRDSTPIEVSTVFLVFDAGPGLGEPILYESAAFLMDGGRPSITLPRIIPGLPWRYATWLAAEAGHARLIDTIRHS